MDDEKRVPGAPGAYEHLDKGKEPPPEEFSNPAGVSRGECDEEGAESNESCDIEVTAQVKDFVLEETFPGYGISGYEGEEDGGG